MTTTLARGANAPVPVARLELSVRGAAPGSVDVMAFQLTADRIVRSDADFVFFNQPGSPEGGLRLQGADRLAVDLDRVPVAIESVAVAVSLDDGQSGTLAAIGDLGVQVAWSGGGIDAPATGLRTERAAVLVELYRRAGAWKVRCVSQGWTGGLAALATEFGVQVETPAPTVAPTRDPRTAPSPGPVGARSSRSVVSAGAVPSVAVVLTAPSAPGGFPPPGGEAPPDPPGPFPRMVAGFPPPGDVTG